MNNRNRKPLIAMIALTAALTLPAFAQSATEEQAAQAPTEQPAPTEAAAPTESATGAAVQQTEQSSTGASSEGGKQGWNDVDTDKDGAISKTEASANAGLSQVFDQADADTDGKLTADEYKAFVSKNYGEPKTP